MPSADNIMKRLKRQLLRRNKIILIQNLLENNQKLKLTVARVQGEMSMVERQKYSSRYPEVEAEDAIGETVAVKNYHIRGVPVPWCIDGASTPNHIFDRSVLRQLLLPLSDAKMRQGLMTQDSCSAPVPAPSVCTLDVLAGSLWPPATNADRIVSVLSR